MKTYTLKPNQKPSDEALRRLSKLKDEDIVYDEDCPEMTPAMEKAFRQAARERNNKRNSVIS